MEVETMEKPPESRMSDFLSNLNTKTSQSSSKEASLIFLKTGKMCFDIDVEKFSLESLKETYARISSLLSKPSVVARLPDEGYQLRQTKIKLQKEIQFRESLNETHEKVQKLSLKCASETNVENAHTIRLCSLERKPQQRFRPNLSRKSIPSGRTESMGELRTGIKLLDLASSLSLQRQQEKRIKAEQMKAKQNRLMMEALAAKAEEDVSTDSESASVHDCDDSEEELEALNGVQDAHELQKVVKRYIFNHKVEDSNQPGPSGVKMQAKDIPEASGGDHKMEQDKPGPSGMRLEDIIQEEQPNEGASDDED